MVLLLVPALMLLPAGCANRTADEGTEGPSPLYVDPEFAYLAFYDAGEFRLFTTFFRIRNESDDEIGPFYVKYIFHDDTLVENMTMRRKEYASHRDFGSELIRLPTGETYQSGHIFVAEDNPNLEDILRNEVGPERILEIQFIARDKDKALASSRVDTLEFVGEAS